MLLRGIYFHSKESDFGMLRAHVLNFVQSNGKIRRKHYNRFGKYATEYLHDFQPAIICEKRSSLTCGMYYQFVLYAVEVARVRVAGINHPNYL